tara:strand:- start:68 stop:484 length:417 start_codon:yes stop_codon:yes gene_type:complete
MFKFGNVKENFILNILKNNFSIKFKNKKNFIIINSINKFNEMKKKRENFLFFIVEYKKLNLINKIIILLSIFTNFKFCNNFLIFFVLKKECLACNFLPDWPGNYANSNFIKNLFTWSKKFLFIFIKSKKIKYLVIETK